jgi:copper chaperone CopZ
MKSIKVLFTVIMLTIIGAGVTAQVKSNTQTTRTITESFKVWGKCGMCKDRIENTVKSEGATAAVWNSKTQMLSVTFDSEKTNVEALSKKLALVGHDTEKFKAPDEVYAKLPGCCHYERTK